MNRTFIIQKLRDIYKKYEEHNLNNINFIELFNLNISDKQPLKKKITLRYHSLQIKYHPDKFEGCESKLCNITIKKYIILEGILLSFINDIYRLLMEIINEDIELLRDIIQHPDDNISGDMDFCELKKNNNIIIEVDKCEFKNQKIIEDKKPITNEIINELIKNREKIKIEPKINFDETVSLDDKKKIFNETFNKYRDKELGNSIIPTEYNSDNNENIDQLFKIQSLIECETNRTLESLMRERDELCYTKRNIINK